MKSKFIFLLPLRSLLFIFAGLTISFMLKSTFTDISKWWTATIMIVNIITIIALLMVCRSIGTSYGEFINYEKGKTSIKSAIIGISLVLVISMLGLYGAGFICYGEIPHFPAMMVKPIPIWLAILSLLVLPLTTTMAEDGIYLGVLNQTSSKAVLMTSIFFYALQHCFIPLIPDAKFIFFRFISFLPAAIVMCLWYRKHKNPLPLMIGHFVVNIPTIAVLIATSVSPEIYEQWIK